jgi:hypothetical protein
MRTRSLLLAAILVCSAVVAASAIPENVAFILDASNSMNKPLGAESRLDAAKNALIELLAVVETIERTGLYVYGHRVDKDNEVESCQDIEALFPILPEDAAANDQVLGAIQSLNARGKTPIAEALVAVSNDLLTYGGESVIVLITDGEETCGGDPLVVAEMLGTLDPPMTLHIIGLDVGADVRAVLTAIAAATGGNYYGVEGAEGLYDALYTAAVSEPVEPVETGIPSQFACLGVTNVIYGTEDDDVIYGTAEGDLILGLGGNDFLIGLDGNDVLCGGPGNDILEGGVGHDLLDGGDGDDIIFGGPDNDHICGGAGNDSLEGDSGDDVIDGGLGCDKVLGGYGCDVLYSADGLDTLLEGTIMAGSYSRCPVCEYTCPPIVECPTVVQPACPPTPCPTPCPEPVPPCTEPVVVQPVPIQAACPPPSDLKTLNEGESIQLHGTVSDADCNIVSSAWQASAGLFDDALSLHPVYTAPMISGCEDLDVEVVLTAVDSCGASASDAFMLRILNVNHVPVADAGPAACVDEGASVILHAVASDPDCEGLMIEWTTNGSLGMFEDPYALQPVFIAPMINACAGVDIIATLTVTDPCGATVCDTVLIHVNDVNTAPTVDLGPDFAVDEGLVIQLTPAVADAQGDALTYCWTTTGGVIDNAYAACPTLTVPMTACCAGEDIVVTLTVADPCGLSASDAVTVHVNDVNAAPTVELGPDLCMLECDSLLLSPQVCDPNGDALVYEWSASAGVFADFGAMTTIYTAPATDNCEGIDVVITLTVTDPCGLSATDSIRVRVENINQPPKVHADP